MVSPHVSRSSSAFARCADQLRWPVELGDASTASWFHVSGITPLLGDPAKKSWLAVLQQARHLGLPTSLDLNWRKQLGEESPLSSASGRDGEGNQDEDDGWVFFCIEI